MESPPPAVFHDKAKRTQQGDLLICTVQSSVPMPIKKLRCLSASDLFQVIDLDSTSQNDHKAPPPLPAALNDVKISALND